MNNFRVTYDEILKLISFKDTAEVGETQVIVTYPDGLVIDYGRTLTVANDWLKSVLSRQDLYGNLMQGEYSFTVKRYDVGGAVLNGTETDTFTLSYANPVPTVTETANPFQPRILLTDSTDYDNLLGPDWTFSTLLRIWSANNGFTKNWASVQPSVTLTSGGYWAGNYSWSFEYNSSYDNDNGWVTLNNKSSANGSFDVNPPIMLPELSVLFQCLYNKITLCCDNAQKQEMIDDYVLATSILHNFILAGQASTVDGNTLDSATMTIMLNGSDCQPGILPLLKKWGCYDDGTIAETLLTAYDWCLCDTGGGGGGAVTIEHYEAGTDCWISADLAGTTYSAASGIGTFTLSTGCTIFGGTVRGDGSTATHTSNSATNSFKLVIPVDADNSNLSYASALLASVSVWSAPDSDPTASAPWVLDEGSVQKRITDISSGEISFVFAGIGATYADGWAITFETP